MIGGEAKEETSMHDPRYPIGGFDKPATIDAGLRDTYIQQIHAAPAALRAAVEGLDEQQLQTPYREGGWNPRQVVHHLADSHMNAYIRFKLALTEKEPTIKPYDEAAWAELADAHDGEIRQSLDLLENLHGRWTACIRSLPEEAFERRLRHPENGMFRLDQLLALYAWHGRHHTAQITSLRDRMGWR
jgi:uncharacterized damage-inducible protein DinB